MSVPCLRRKGTETCLPFHLYLFSLPTPPTICCRQTWRVAAQSTVLHSPCSPNIPLALANSYLPFRTSTQVLLPQSGIIPPIPVWIRPLVPYHSILYIVLLHHIIIPCLFLQLDYKLLGSHQ